MPPNASWHTIVVIDYSTFKKSRLFGKRLFMESAIQKSFEEIFAKHEKRIYFLYSQLAY